MIWIKLAECSDALSVGIEEIDEQRKVLVGHMVDLQA